MLCLTQHRTYKSFWGGNPTNFLTGESMKTTYNTRSPAVARDGRPYWPSTNLPDNSGTNACSIFLHAGKIQHAGCEVVK